MEKITKLLSAEVVDEHGKRLGYVVDLRSDGEPEHGLVNNSRPITELIYCKNRLLYFFGSQGAGVRIVPWTSVKQFSSRRVVIEESHSE
jgi:sporulation protein YlmC with PRC-barrel domain